MRPIKKLEWREHTPGPDSWLYGWKCIVLVISFVDPELTGRFCFYSSFIINLWDRGTPTKEERCQAFCGIKKRLKEYEEKISEL